MPERRFLHKRSATYKRRSNRFEPRQQFLIVCEGEKTEPKYFEKFPIPKDSVVNVIGVGANTVSLVQEALRLASDSIYDQVWCVFDRNSFSAENFNAALQMAEAHKVKVAYSDEAFELWYVLHFDYLNTGISRGDYIRRLEAKLGHPYRKNSDTMYDEIYTQQADAIRNASRLLSQYIPPNPAADNPSTTVHLLVEQLNRLFWD